MIQYLKNLLLWLDNGVVTLLGFDPRLTISAVLALYRAECKLCVIACRWLDRMDDRHCDKSIVNWTNFKRYDRSLWPFPD